MKILFFDTETSGFPSKKLAKDDPKQAWIIQIGLITMNDNIKNLHGAYLIKPEDRTIHPRAQEVHNISTKMAEESGYSEAFISDLFSILLSQTDLIVGHNISFDIKMLELLFYRNGRADIAKKMLQIPTQCTMLSSTNLCKLPGKFGYKWPKLTELYQYLFNEVFSAHDALEDIQATVRCYQELLQKGVKF